MSALRIVRHVEPARRPETAPPAAPSALMDVGELCHHTRSSLRTVRRWLAAGKVPGMVRLPGGRAVRFRRDVIEAWMAAGCPDAGTKN